MRKLCKNCAEPYEPNKDLLIEYNWSDNLEIPTMLWRASREGCPNCDHSGYKGRLVVGELIVISDKIASSIIGVNSSSEIEKIAISEGTRTLHMDALQWVVEGETSLEEVKRAGV